MTLNSQPSPALPVLSHFQTTPLLKARDKGMEFGVISTDLGITAVQVAMHEDGIVLPDATTLVWYAIEEIDSNENGCFYIKDGVPAAIRGFSETLGRACSLMPTATAPVLVIAGFPMHRFKDIAPVKAAEAMVEPLLPLRGEVLDTATGLGYTSIIASQTGARITTIELCAITQEMARMNPWSQRLFNNPDIARIMGDTFEEIVKFPDEHFSAMIHDPPTMSLAGDLYSGEFYKQAFRVLKQRGRMFHYIGDPQSANGARVTKGVIRRLYDAGFKKVVSLPKAFGVVANK